MLLRIASFLALIATASAGVCSDATYTQIAGGDCFKVYQQSLTFSDAELQCLADGGDLASIHNSVEERGLASMVPTGTTAVIGLQCTSTTSCGWTDGTPYDFSSFNGGVPVLAYGNCAAVSATDGQWYSTTCTAQQTGFICRIRSGSPTPTGCGDYTSYNGYCIKAKSFPRSADDAEADCAADGGHLMSIHTDSDNTLFKNFLLNSGINETAHIGLQNTYFGYYQWTDGSTVDYTSWAKYFPNSRFGDCVQMIISSDLGTFGQWINEQCSQPYPYLCKRIAGLTPTFAPSTCPNLQMFEDAGVIYSPGFPLSIPPRTKCEYLLTGRSGSQVQLHFPVFYTDKSSTVSIYDGIVTTVPMSTYAGNYGSIRTINSTGNILKIVFQTGSAPAGEGWEARFTTTGFYPSTRPVIRTTMLPPPTTTTRPIVLSSQSPISTNCPMSNYYTNTTLFGPGYPGFYPGNMNCNYYVRSAQLLRVYIDFGAIDLVGADMITVFDGSSTSDYVLGRITGKYPAHKVSFKSTGSWLTVNFRSFINSQGGGFTANVYNA